MDHPVTNTGQDRYTSNPNQSDGMEYQRLLAMHLLLKATLDQRPFKLAFEMKQPKLFDDVVFHLLDTKEWWFIQSKYTETNEKLTKSRLFNNKKPAFLLHRYLSSYCNIREEYEGKNKYIILTTHEVNPGLSILCEEVEIDNFLDIGSKSSHFQLTYQLVDLETLKTLINQTNKNFNDYCSDVKKLSKNVNNDVIDKILKHKIPLSIFFEKKSNGIQLKDTKVSRDRNQRSYKLFETLKQKFGDQIVPLNEFQIDRLFEGNNKIPLVVDRDLIRNNFFKDFYLSHSHPKLKEFKDIINKELVLWMRTWISTDDFGSLNSDQLKFAFRELDEFTKQWIGDQNNEHKNRTRQRSRNFLTLDKCVEWLESTKQKINTIIEEKRKTSCVSLKSVQNYYINRKISYFSNKKFSISDDDFIRQLFTTFQHQQCFVLVTAPGMGKSVLCQYLAFEAQKQYKDMHVYLLYLNNFQEKITAMNNTDDVLQIFEKHLPKENCENLKNSASKIILFLDALDEANLENINFLIKAFEILLRKENFKLFITSRQRLQKKLEKKFKIKAMTVDPLDEIGQLAFLKKFWNIKEDSLGKFDELFTKQYLQTFRIDGIGNHRDLFGTPLLVRMLAEIYSDFFKEADSKLSMKNDFNNQLKLVDVYDKFVTKCLNETLNKINNSQFGAEHSKRLKIMPEYLRNEYQKLAFAEKMPDELITLMCEQHFTTNIRQIRLRILHDKEESLLIEALADGLKFAHQSYSEFLAAEYLYKRIDEIDISEIDSYKLKALEVLEKQEIIRLFLFEMINSKMKDIHLEFLEAIGEQSAFWACQGNCRNLVKYLMEIEDKQSNNLEKNFFYIMLLVVVLKKL